MQTRASSTAEENAPLPINGRLPGPLISWSPLLLPARLRHPQCISPAMPNCDSRRQPAGHLRRSRPCLQPQCTQSVGKASSACLLWRTINCACNGFGAKLRCRRSFLKRGLGCVQAKHAGRSVTAPGLVHQRPVGPKPCQEAPPNQCLRFRLKAKAPGRLSQQEGFPTRACPVATPVYRFQVRQAQLESKWEATWAGELFPCWGGQKPRDCY